ncbi:TetR/AcrR family transcriptional regulator [soil metagenome]
MDLPRLLPLVDAPTPERADAARNREALLRAAAELIDRCSVENVTMDAVAARAGVGKGTVFRRFESREGLMAALLDRSETAWQAAVLSGPPPLGPGAPPMERLLAFGGSRIETTLHHAALIRAAGQAGARAIGPVSFTAMHVRYLLGELGVRGDLGYLATALLAPLEIPILEQQVRLEHVPLERIHEGWRDLVQRVVTPRGGDAGRR